jgi:hypothetical protein
MVVAWVVRGPVRARLFRVGGFGANGSFRCPWMMQRNMAAAPISAQVVDFKPFNGVAPVLLNTSR